MTPRTASRVALKGSTPLYLASSSSVMFPTLLRSRGSSWGPRMDRSTYRAAIRTKRAASSRG